MTQALDAQIEQLTREFHTAKAASNTAWRVAQTHKNEVKLAQSEADRATKKAEYLRMFEVYKQAQAAANEIWGRLEAAQIEADQ